jgi:septum formation protein
MRQNGFGTLPGVIAEKRDVAQPGRLADIAPMPGYLRLDVSTAPYPIRLETALRLILASGSPARQSLLRDAGLNFSVMPPEVDEAALKRGFDGAPVELARALASAKAATVAACDGQALVIGADQLLVCEGKKFDKPVDLADAARHLRHLSGRTHRLVTAVCVHRGDACLWSNVAEASLTMRPLSEAFIAQYLAAEGQGLCGCVGAYRLEGRGAQLFSAVEGDFFTVLGLNLLPLLGFLREAGVLAV